MKFTNIFEKIGIIFNMIISSNLLIVLIFLMIAALLLKLANKINNKKLGIILYVIQLSGLVYMIYTNTEYLSNLEISFLIEYGRYCLGCFFGNTPNK